MLPPEEDVVELDPLSEVLAALDEADVDSDEPDPPDATESISEAVSHAVNKAAPAASNKNLFMSSPR